MELTVHEQGCSFRAPSFSLSHHLGHGRAPALIHPTQMKEVAARAKVDIERMVSLSPAHFQLLSGL